MNSTQGVMEAINSLFLAIEGQAEQGRQAEPQGQTERRRDKERTEEFVKVLLNNTT